MAPCLLTLLSNRLSKGDCNIRVGWEDAQSFLDAQPGAHATFHYQVGPEGSQRALSKTIGAQAERVDGGRQTEVVQESCSFVYHCFRGSGSTTLQLADGSSTEVAWKAGDTFAVPTWSIRTHKSDADRSYLFAVNDRPLLENLGMYRKA